MPVNDPACRQRRWTVLDDAKPRSITEVVDILLRNRRVENVSFLHSDLNDLQAHLGLLNLDQAARCLVDRLNRHDRLLLIGDYDCDGISAAALMSLFLRDLGYTEFEVILPTRAEGYGIPARALGRAPAPGLAIVMDCGTSEVEAIAALRAAGAEVIVLDHHEVRAGATAAATALVNPKQPGCPAPFRELCSAGLVLLFLIRARRHLDQRWPRPKLDGRYLALAALATVADMVPLLEANRIIVQAGLRALNQGRLPGLEQLRSGAGLARTALKSSHLAFQLAPRINAAGRLADPLQAYDLLLAVDAGYAALLANQLDQLNRRRQRLEQEALATIRQQLPAAAAGLGQRTLVLGDAAWDPGLIGILASRVRREFHYGPVIVCAYDESAGVARGSARGIPGFDLQQALGACDGLMTRWGGHRMAAGLTLPLANVAAFREAFEAYSRGCEPALWVREERIDLELDPGLISSGLLDALAALEPHGMGNPAPLFLARNRTVAVQRTFGRQGTHVNLLVDGTVPAVFWNGAEPARNFLDGGHASADLVYDLDWDNYRQRPRMRIQALLADGRRGR